MADRYLSEVFDIDKEVATFGNKLFLIAGVGAGKSKFVTKYLASKGSVLFVTSRKAKVEADIANSTFSGTYRDNFNNNQLLVTNAKLASMVHKISNTHLQEIDDFIDHFDYIVIDEVHSLAADSIFAPSSGPVLSFMEYAANKGKVVIAMTGTPDPIEYYFRDNNWAIRDYRDDCVYLHPQQVEIISKRSVLKTIILHLGKSKIVYFANKTNSITQLCKLLINDEHISANKISVIVARSREKEYMESLKSFSSNHGEIIETESQKTYESIINEECIPDACHILFATSTLKEGLNFNNEKIVMICENHLLSNLIQYWGRARLRECMVYIVADSQDHESKRNELIYEYACSKEVIAANEFMQERILSPHNALSNLEKEKFVEYVEASNQYLYFDFISLCFKVLHLRYNEEQRILQSHNWKEILFAHCRKYGITHFDWTSRALWEEALLRMADMKLKSFANSKERTLILTALYYVYGIEAKQLESINVLLAQYHAPVRLDDHKETKGEFRNKHYWQLVKYQN